jgi:hypothetical protein
MIVCQQRLFASVMFLSVFFSYCFLLLSYLSCIGICLRSFVNPGKVLRQN